jgi:DNA-binding ferritin-like protein
MIFAFSEEVTQELYWLHPWCEKSMKGVVEQSAALEQALRAKLDSCQSLSDQLSREMAKGVTASTRKLRLVTKDVERWKALAERSKASGSESLRQLRQFNQKKQRAIEAGRWDRRKKITNMLSPAQEKMVAIKYVNSRIFSNGEYTAGRHKQV